MCRSFRAERTAERVRLGVWQLQKGVEQAEFAHHFERGGMDRVAAKVAEEIGVLFQNHDLDAGARQEVAEHHPAWAAAHDAATRGQLICHHPAPRPNRENAGNDDAFREGG